MNDSCIEIDLMDIILIQKTYFYYRFIERDKSYGSKIIKD